MVDYEHIDMAEKLRCSVDDLCRRVRPDKVGLDVFKAFSIFSKGLDHTLHPDGVATPWLLGVMGGPRLDQHAHPRFQEVTRNGVTDTRLPAHAGHDGNSARPRLGHSP